MSVKRRFICKRGHVLDEKTQRQYTRPDGRPYWICLRCKAQSARLKYRNDEAFRARERARCLARYYAEAA